MPCASRNTGAPDAMGCPAAQRYSDARTPEGGSAGRARHRSGTGQRQGYVGRPLMRPPADFSCCRGGVRRSASRALPSSCRRLLQCQRVCRRGERGRQDVRGMFRNRDDNGADAVRLIANARMYGAGPRCRQLWNELVMHVSRISGVHLHMLEHAPPAPMTDLWNRADMGFVQMCGWPFWRSNPRPRLVAAAVLDHEYCEDSPLYWTDMLVRRDDTAESLEDLFQRRIGWTTEHSHSGYNAPRRLLLHHFPHDERTPVLPKPRSVHVADGDHPCTSQ